MPIEIKELVIKTTVSENQDYSGNSEQSLKASKESAPVNDDCAAKLEEVRDEIIAECLDFVSDYLNKINRR